MTGICGIAGETTAEIDKMLSSMSLRGHLKDEHSVRKGGKSITIGLCSAKPQNASILDIGDATIALDGAFFVETPLKEILSKMVSEGPEKILDIPGSFSFLAIQDGNLITGRDPLGQKPLYHGRNEQGNYGFASLKTALRKVGVQDVEPIPPGCTLTISQGRHALDTVGKLARPKSQQIDEASAVETLESLLLQAVSLMVPGEAALAFSGGLDSSLVAEAMRRRGLRPHLITVGVGEQPEMHHASEIAEEMGLDLTSRVLLEQEVLDSVSPVAETIETTDPTIVSIAVPFCFACQEAQDIGVETIVAGQLSDELFGGYARFEELALQGRAEDLDAQLWNSVMAASTNDFEPGDKIAEALGLELRCPFAYLPLAEYALRMPTNLKVRSTGEEITRKYVLRELARKWGLPDSVVNRPKKAVQYSSGVHKVLIGEAKRRNLTLNTLISTSPA